MPGTPGARTGLAQINPTGESPTILRTTTNAVIAWLEANAMLTAAGLLVDRPPSTPASPGITGRRYYATDTGVEYRDTGTGWMALGVELVTALPASPYEGQIVDYLADATNGRVWRLRYRAASTSTYKWEVVGASDLSERGTNVAYGGGDFSTSSTTYIDVPGMSGITLPLAGDYAVDYGFTELRSDTTGQGRWWGLVLNSGTPPIEHFFQASVVSDYGRGSRYTRDWTALAASSVLRLRVRTSGVGVAVFNGGYLRVRPIRVG